MAHSNLAKPENLGTSEPPRVSERLHSLGGWSHGKTDSVLTGDA